MDRFQLPLVLVSHGTQEMLRFADTVAVLSRRRIISCRGGDAEPFAPSAVNLAMAQTAMP